MASFTQKRREQEKTIKDGPKPSEVDPHPKIHGVLLSDEIIFYAENHRLIEPFERANLKPAAYELTVGDEYFRDGNFHDLSEDGTLVIPPFEVAVLKTREILRLPRYLIARWNIRVTHAYRGLLWVGGPQVDPGWVGHLFCPIYNLSDKEVRLRAGEQIAVMDFVKTTPFDPDKSEDELKRYRFPPKRSFIEEYGIEGLKSALYTEAGQKIKEVDEKVKALEGRFITFTQISFAIFALVIALVGAISRTTAENISLSAIFFAVITLGLSTAAVLMAFFSLVAPRSKDDHRGWKITIAIIIAVITSGIFYEANEAAIRDFRERPPATNTRLDALKQADSDEIRALADRVVGLEHQRAAISEQLEKLMQELNKLSISSKPAGR